jgi:N-hydroxyarylamine O-acetyltransferase
MEIKPYLKRINYAGVLNCSKATLESLQEHHLFSVPFENIDIYNSTPIYLQSRLFYKKVVLIKRGGYCYELNGLFLQLLLQLGFDAHLISGRVVKGKNIGPEYDHMAILVHVDGKQWLVDVGYGDFSFKPLTIEPGLVQFDGRNHYKIDVIQLDGEECLSAAKWSANKNAYVPQYYFSTVKRELIDFQDMNHYHQTSEHSHFTQSLICSIPTKQGRVSLINNHVIITTGKLRKEMKVEHEKLSGALKSHFGITINVPIPTDLHLSPTASKFIL